MVTQSLCLNSTTSIYEEGRIEGWVGLDWVWVETFNWLECFQSKQKPHRRLGWIEFGSRFELLVEKKFNHKSHMDTN